MSSQQICSTPRRILVFRSAALGDFILSCPALNLLRSSYPDHELILVSIYSSEKSQRNKVSRYILPSVESHAGLPWLNLVMPHLISKYIFIENPLSPVEILAKFALISNLRIEFSVLFVDAYSPWLGRVFKYIFLKLLTMFKPVYGWRWTGSRKTLLDANGNCPRIHHVHGPLFFMQEHPINSDYLDTDIIFNLRVPEPDYAWAVSWIKNHQLNEKRIIALAPGSIHTHKQWPLSNYIELIRRIYCAYSDISIVVIGTPQDRSIALDMQRSLDFPVLSLAGIANISRCAAFLSMCSLLVGNDGGAIHLGDAMGCKVVSIISGIEYPGAVDPWHNKQYSVRSSVECSPCYSFTTCPEGHMQCIRNISVESVYSMCSKALS